jgi:hypothetical protein
LNSLPPGGSAHMIVRFSLTGDVRRHLRAIFEIAHRPGHCHEHIPPDDLSTVIFHSMFG